MGRSRRRFARVGLALAGVLSALALCEWSVANCAPQLLDTDRLRFENVAGPGFRLEPFQRAPGRMGGVINSLGLRGPEPGTPRAGVERVLVLGDSFVFGAGVEFDQTFSAQLDRALRARQVEFVNAGTPSYGTLRELHWLEKYGPGLDPDQLLLCFFVGNDFTDNLEDEPPRIHDGRLVSPDKREDSDFELEFALRLREFHLVRLWQRWSAGQRELEFAPAVPAQAAAAPETNAGSTDKQLSFETEQLKRLDIYPVHGNVRPAIRKAYAGAEQCLDWVQAWCRDRGIELRLVLLPDLLQVDEALLSKVLARAGLERDSLELERPQRALLDWAAKHSVAALDLLPAFREHQAADELLYLPRDSHFSARGHELAAAELRRAFWP